MTIADSDIANARTEVGLELASAGDYFALLKPRVMSLVVFTAFVGMMIAPGSVHPVIGFTAILCIAVGAGASGALNMWYDGDIDRLMSRTAQRPVPAGRVTPEEALTFGLILSVGSVTILGLLVDWVAASMLAFTIFFYVVIYTIWLKRLTPQNIVIGGAAGAFPPIIGWASVTGSISIEPVILFAIIFLWTPPHFWALALYRTGDYERAGVPMLPCTAGSEATSTQILIYALILAPFAVLPFIMGFAGPAYGTIAVVSGVLFVALAAQVKFAQSHEKRDTAAKKLFAFSVLYLLVLFAVLLIESGMGL